MSGGSYDYIYLKDASELLDMKDTVQRMADRLAGLGYADDAAQETQAVVQTLRQFHNRITVMTRRLERVWQAVEYEDSGDGNPMQINNALAAYRGETL